MAADDPTLRGNRPRTRGRRRTVAAAIILAACLVPMLAAVLLSSSLRRRLGLEAPGGAIAAGGRVRPALAGPGVPAKSEAPIERPKAAEANAPVGGPGKASEPVADADATPKVEAAPDLATKPVPPTAATAMEPLIRAVATPPVSVTTLGLSARPDRVIELREDTKDQVELFNGPGFRLAEVMARPPTWEVATRTVSGLAGEYRLARLTHTDPLVWRFEWTPDAKTHSSDVKALKDTILGLHGRDDGRPIYLLLRDVKPDSDRPLMFWKDERIFDKLEPRVRSRRWAGEPVVLEGSQWKPRIRRWRVVFSRPGSGAAGDDPLTRVFEPEAPTDEKAAAQGPSLRRDLVPGEIRFSLAIDASHPGSIDVHIDPYPEQVRAGRERRSARREELRKATPRGRDQSDRDMIEYRQGRVLKLQEDVAKHADEIKDRKREIDELTQIEEIRGTEDLLSRPATCELSVVIGLDVEGPGILDIVRIGAFAGGR
jgi:hypothetical protein